MTPRRAPNDAGFTLVEVLAALALFSVSALALVRVSAETARTAILIETRALAAIVADNRLAEALADRSTIETGVEVFDAELAGRLWTVEQRTEETPNAAVVQVTVVAYETDEGGDATGPQFERIAFKAAQ